MAEAATTRTTRFEVDGPQHVDLRSTNFIDPARTTAGSFTEIGHIYLEKMVQGRLLAGVWACGPATIRHTSFPSIEFGSVVEGTVEITDESGDTEVFEPGDFFMVPAGMRLTWHMPKRFVQHFVALSPDAANIPPAIVRTIRFALDGPRLRPMSYVDPARVTAGSANETGHVYFDEHVRGKLVAGAWQCGSTTTRHTAFPSTEFVHVVEGVEEITDAAGHKEVYEAGDFFVVPAGMPMTGIPQGSSSSSSLRSFPIRERALSQLAHAIAQRVGRCLERRRGAAGSTLGHSITYRIAPSEASLVTLPQLGH